MERLLRDDVRDRLIPFSVCAAGHLERGVFVDKRGAISIQAEIVCDRRRGRNARAAQRRREHSLHLFINNASNSARSNGSDAHAQNGGEQLRHESNKLAHGARLLTYSFLRLANLESGAFGLLNRYEVALWRQIVQTIIALRGMHRRALIAGRQQLL